MSIHSASLSCALIHYLRKLNHFLFLKAMSGFQVMWQVAEGLEAVVAAGAG